jgi:hypothetical protein
MPLSQEAQLMSISRLLERARTQFIVINASNVLDQLFLAKFLRRACPEARLVFIGGDLLFGRETENAPYVGSITLSAYSLLSPAPAPADGSPTDLRAFADSSTEAYFNAASYILWDGNQLSNLRLANYRDPFQENSSLHTPMWAVAMGNDGYYPLGLVDSCASDFENILPRIEAGDSRSVVETNCVNISPGKDTPARANFRTRLEWLFDFYNDHYRLRPYRYPALSWKMLCVFLCVLCIVHTFAVSFPRYWSPWTRDLAIEQGDRQYRRSMYIYIGSIMLFCMAFATAYPLFPSFHFIHPNWHTALYSLVTLYFAAMALVTTFLKTRRYFTSRTPEESVPAESGRLDRLRIWLNGNVVFLFKIGASTTLVVFLTLWLFICNSERVDGMVGHVGPLFSYRCLYPGSGVSPLVPLLLILFGWYVWAFLQTLRLRFSKKDRPRLPGTVQGTLSWPLFVSDEEISADQGEASYLIPNVMCLLITREVVRRVFPGKKWSPTLSLVGVYLGLFMILVFGLQVGSVDRILWHPGLFPTKYEFLVGALAFPLVMIAWSSWLRMILVWASLKRGLLERLEQLPIRYAFTRLKGIGWINMMRQGGLLEQWRDMARSTESMRQMVHDPAMMAAFALEQEPRKSSLQSAQESLDSWIQKLNCIVNRKIPLVGPREDPQAALDCMVEIEKCYARACEGLLDVILIPYWEQKRVGLVEGDDLVELPIKAHALPKEDAGSRSHTPLQLRTSSVGEEPVHIRIAEEFLAIRYVSLIRAVLVNMSRMLLLISAVFVLTIVAWNSYPFQPRQLIDEGFTALLLLLGTGVIWVFAQMHRDPILSRITDTSANELGSDFYLRILAFGTVPVLTWLAYQFPEVWGTVLRFIQPSLGAFK